MVQKIEYEDAKRKASSLKDVAKALTKAGNQKLSLATLQHAVEVARTIEDENEKAATLSRIAQGLVEAGFGMRAVEVAQEIGEVKDEKASTLREIVLGLAEAGDSKQAIEVAQKIWSAPQKLSHVL